MRNGGHVISSVPPSGSAVQSRAPLTANRSGSCPPSALEARHQYNEARWLKLVTSGEGLASHGAPEPAWATVEAAWLTMPLSPRYVLTATHDGHSQITRLFDFINAAAIAMWNLRWQVNGFLQSYPTATQETLKGRFALGSGLRGGELKRACVETSWEKQQEEFAAVVLINAIAIYEDFTASIVAKAALTKSRDTADALQFPKALTASDHDGYDWSFARFGPSVPELRGVFYMGHGAKRYAGLNINKLMICYRYFKEMRNAIAHNGGKANQRMLDAYQAFSAVATVAELGLEEVPPHHRVSLGHPVKLDLRGVTGLCNVVLRLMVTLDAELSDRNVALIEFDERVAAIRPNMRMPPGDTIRKTERFQRLIHEGKFPRAEITTGLQSHMKATRKIPAFW